MAFLDSEVNLEENKKAMKLRSFRYGTPLMPSIVRGITAKLPPHLKPMDPAKFDEEAKMEFAANFSTTQRMGPNLELTGRYPSVSAFLGAAESDQTKLFNWQSKQIQEMGYSGFKSYMGKRTKSGTNFHNTIKNLLDGFKKSGKLTDEACRDAVEKQALEENRGYIEGIIPFLKNIPHRDWMAMEKATKNHYYCFQGRFDAIVEIEGEPTLVDWKTVSSASYKHHGVNDLRRLYGVPLQVVAYIVAVNTDPDYSYMPRIKQGAVVLAYEDGRPAEAVIIHEDELKEYYKTLAEKINAFWWKMEHPSKKEIDGLGNVNFVFNPALNPPPPPEVIVLEDEVIVDPKTPKATQDSAESSEDETKPKKLFAVFEKKGKKSKAAAHETSVKNSSVFGI